MAGRADRKKPRFIANGSDKTYSMNNKATDVLKTNQWKGKPCYIVAGGEALADFDFTRLKGQHTIGVNKTFLYFEPEILYSMDVRYYFWIMEGKMDNHDKDSVKGKWLAFKGTKIFLCPMSHHKLHHYSNYQQFHDIIVLYYLLYIQFQLFLHHYLMNLLFYF